MYLLWQSKTGWNISHIMGLETEHTRHNITRTDGRRYLKAQGLRHQECPLDEELAEMCEDTFEYRKEREYVRQDA